MSEAPALGGLSPKKLRELRAKAHALKPVVWLSQHGMSEGAMREVERALSAHELIKIHAAADDRQAREALLASICGALGAEPVQVIGKILVAFRPKPAPPPQRATSDPGQRRPGGGRRVSRPGRTSDDAPVPKRVRRSKPRG